MACRLLPAAKNKPEYFMAGLCFPLFRSSVKRDGEVFKPDEEDGGVDIVDHHFSAHMAMQKKT